MKKKLLFLGALVLSSMSAFAQWTLPEVKTSDLVVGEPMYLYNKEAGAFLRGLGEGNNSPYWGTRAGVAVEGADSVKINPALAENVPENTRVSADVDIPWLEEWDGKTCLVQVWSSHRHKMWDELWFSMTDFNELYIDRQYNVNGNTNFFWNVEKNANGSYSISVSNKSTFFDPELYAELTKTDPETGEVTSAPVLVGGEKLGVDLSSADLVAYLEGYNDGAPLSCEWYFVSKADYEALDFEDFSRYYEAMSLRNFIDENKAAYPEVDFSAAEAVYNNTASTLEELQAAKELVKKAILDFQANEASPSNPKDVTSSITNSSFDVQGDFTGWSGDKFNAGGNASTCAEFWNYSAFNAYQDLTNLPSGIYKLGAKSFYRAGGASEDWNTKDDPAYRLVKLYARSGEDSLYTSIPSISSTAADYKVGVDDATVNDGTLYVANSMVDFTAYKEAGFIPETSVLVPVSNGEMRIGVVKNTGIGNDWFVIDDFTLTYYGNSVESYGLWRDEFLASVPSVDDFITEETLYNEAYKTAVEDAIATAKNSTDKDVIAESVKAVTPAIEALQENIAAYAAYLAKVQEVDEYFADHDDLEGDSVDYITDYLQDESEAGEYYPNGGAIYIKENASLTTEQIIAETENVERWFQAAVKYGMKKGSDVSFLLVNPTFADGFNGWTRNSGNVGGVKEVCPNVEIYENPVDVYQIVEGVPAGIYSINVQAFERPAAPWDITGDEISKVFLFMNEYQTPVMRIVDDLAPYESAQDRVDSYFIDSSTGEAVPTSTDKWPYDYGYDGVDYTGWMPHSMDGASYAFAGGRYVNTCYGIVGEDGVMKIGLTSNGVRAHWVLWANFKLIYEGESVEAIEAILETTINNANNFLTEKESEMNALAKNELLAAMAAAEDAYSTDYETVYKALNTLTAALAAAREHVDLYAALVDAQFNMDETAAIYYEIASVEALEAYEATFAKLGDVDNLTNAEILALTKECEYVTAALKLPSGLEECNDENPADLTELIVNPDFSLGNATGWKYAIDPISNLGYQGANYSNGEVSINQFIEGWREGNQPMGNGTIEQTLNALPAGTYVLGVDLVANLQSGTAADTKGVYLFASEENGAKASIEVATDNGAPQHFELIFKKTESSTAVTIGVEALNTTANWIAADNFTLMYYGTASAKEAVGDATGIESVESVEVVSSAYYTLGGAKVSAPVKGINIMKSVLSNGKVKVQKVFVK